MIVENINKNPPSLKVLVAPLDWGLGHATRCIPIIHALLELKVTVVLAASGSIANLFEKEFPNLRILPLTGYNITYAAKKSLFKYALFLKLPGIVESIRAEKKWLRKLVAAEHFDAIISDNRFGMYHPKVQTIYITHQLNIQTGNMILNSLARRIHYSFINKFTECWVPDAQSDPNMGGLLSHPVVLPDVPIKYLGLISRFQQRKIVEDIDLLVILSGPEPQRSILEELVLSQLPSIPLKAVLVRGLPGGPSLDFSSYPEIEMYDHLPAEELSTLIQRSKMLLCRCGYSTVMDLAVLNKKAILIPTPGQTEQEYLAGYLFKKGYFFTCYQETFNLRTVLKTASQFSWTDFPGSSEAYKDVITDFIERLQASS